MSVSERTALISVWDKRGVADLGRALARLKFSILSTGGTARLLEAEGIAVVQLSDYTGSPEMLDGRVKSLHPRVHAGILALRGRPDHLAQLKENGIRPIDLVAVNLYPFAESARAPGNSSAQVLEQIDIGGVALLRAAAKNYRDVVALCDPDDYQPVVREMAAGGGAVPEAMRRDLAAKAFRLTCRYDAGIAGYLTGSAGDGLPPTLELLSPLALELRYGENPHQRAAFYERAGEGTTISGARLLQGKELSYNNILDLESALSLALELEGRAAVIVKHNNPCGAAASDDLLPSYLRARQTDPVSAFGGVIALTDEVDERLAGEIISTFVEAVLAPSFSPGARSVLAGRKDLRVLEAGRFRPRPPSFAFRSISGGILVQDEDALAWRKEELKTVTRRKPTAEEWEGLAFAWKVCKHTRSNAIVLGRGRATVGIGAGQMSRIDAAVLAVLKAKNAGQEVKGGVLASDAFFPFRDVVDLAAREGVRAIVQPGGSIRDEESIRAADEHGLAMVFTGIRHFRH